MIVKFFPRGRGGKREAGPVKYALKDKAPHWDEEGKPLRDESGRVIEFKRDPRPELLRGNSEDAERLIESNTNERKYKSGVLSFAPGETITPAMEEDIMDRFEAAAFAGLERDQYVCVWVRHTHEGHHELHFVIPQIELTTGKALNPDPPGDASRELFDTFREIVNEAYGLASPDAPERARLVKTPGHVEKFHAAQLREGKPVESDPRQLITGYVAEEIRLGLVKDRQDVLSALHRAGLETPRVGKQYITAKDPETGLKWRLRGGAYEESWTASRTIERANEPGYREIPGTDGNRVAGLEQRLERLCSKRSDYNQKRYGGVAERSKSLSVGVPASGKVHSVEYQNIKDHSAIFKPLPEFLDFKLHAAAIKPLVSRELEHSAEVKRNEEHTRDGNRSARKNEEGVREVQSRIIGTKQRSEVRSNAEGNESFRQGFENGRRSVGIPNRGLNNDGTREAVDRSIQDIGRTIESTIAIAKEGNSCIEQASAELARSIHTGDNRIAQSIEELTGSIPTGDFGITQASAGLDECISKARSTFEAVERLAFNNKVKKMEPKESSGYITQIRKIPKGILKNERFKGTVLKDPGRKNDKNITFAYQDSKGFCGLEERGKNFKEFSKDVTSGIWKSNKNPNDETLVITEGPIEALSLASVYVKKELSSTRFIATDGAISKKQLDLIAQEVNEMPKGALVLLAFGNSQEGGKLTDLVYSLDVLEHYKAKRLSPKEQNCETWSQYCGVVAERSQGVER